MKNENFSDHITKESHRSNQHIYTGNTCFNNGKLKNQHSKLFLYYTRQSGVVSKLQVSVHCTLRVVRQSPRSRGRKVAGRLLKSEHRSAAVAADPSRAGFCCSLVREVEASQQVELSQRILLKHVLFSNKYRIRNLRKIVRH